MSASANIERLIVMSERISAALEADIAALEQGNARAMRAIEPDMQQLSAIYVREASALTREAAEAAPAALRARFAQATRRFHDALKRHGRVLTRIRNASEGMIRAIAEEVERQQAPVRTYRPAQPRANRPAAMLYNSVI